MNKIFVWCGHILASSRSLFVASHLELRAPASIHENLLAAIIYTELPGCKIFTSRTGERGFINVSF